MAENNLRNRKGGAAPTISAPTSGASRKPSKTSGDDQEVHGISLLDIIRVLLGIFFLSSATSWFVTDGESLLWGYRPQISRWRTWKSLLQPEIILTDAELEQYDGSNSDKPIYVAVNGSVFDVSANPGMYGPGGGYSFFAGRDAARAFVSGCFQDDLTWDLRGLEEMYITGENRKEDDAQAAEIYELNRFIKNGEFAEKFQDLPVPEGRLRWLKQEREKRRAAALEKVDKQIKHWDNFFRNHDRYFYVGRVIHPSLEGTPIRKLCTAQGKPGKKRS